MRMISDSRRTRTGSDRTVSQIKTVYAPAYAAGPPDFNPDEQFATLKDTHRVIPASRSMRPLFACRLALFGSQGFD